MPQIWPKHFSFVEQQALTQGIIFDLWTWRKKTEEKIVRTVPTNSWFEQYCPWTSVTVSSIPRQGFGLSPIWELPGNWGAVYTNIEEEKTKHYGFFCIFFYIFDVDISEFSLYSIRSAIISRNCIILCHIALNDHNPVHMQFVCLPIFVIPPPHVFINGKIQTWQWNWEDSFEKKLNRLFCVDDTVWVCNWGIVSISWFKRYKSNVLLHGSSPLTRLTFKLEVQIKEFTNVEKNIYGYKVNC